MKVKIYRRAGGIAFGNIQKIFSDTYEFDFGYWFIQITLQQKRKEKIK